MDAVSSGIPRMSTDCTQGAGASAEAPARTLIELFARQAETSPGRIAVSSPQGSLSFAQLRRRSQQAAWRLRDAGVQPGQCVGLFVDPSLDMMIGTWGILEAGCAYLPLAPEYPRERIRYMIEDAGITVIYTQPALLPSLRALALDGVRLVCDDGAARPAANDARTQAPVLVEAHSLAYVIYTSGTTGQPKGVEITHANLINQLAWLRDVHGVDARQTLLRKTPMSFDAAQWELLSVANGTQVVIGAPGIHRDPEALVATLIEHHISVLQGVPTLLQALVNEPGFADCQTLTHLYSGGEPLTRKLAQACLDGLPQVRLVNLYGPTECTINASSRVVDAACLADTAQIVSLGFPASGTTLHLFDPVTGAPIDAPETPGELYIGGRQLARGYRGRPEQTAERFVERLLPGHAHPVRLYRTGDLASWNADGSVQFIGRADNQVKLRGYRIELDEVRVAIENHAWVKSAAVFVHAEAEGQRQSLVACVALNPREAILMDQGQHGAHHLSKSSKVQVKAQLGQLGERKAGRDQGRAVLRLPGATASPGQRARAFARKTYRLFEGGRVDRQAILDLLTRQPALRPHASGELTLDTLGTLLRNLGPFHSQERLLPKYAYASPGALYAHQLYLEVEGLEGLADGIHYFAPTAHELVMIEARPSTGQPRVVLHLVGRAPAIEAVYQTNVDEVLEMEAGHVLGLLDQVLPEQGLGLGAGTHRPDMLAHLAVEEGDRYLGSYPLVSAAHAVEANPVQLYVQAHGDQVDDLPAGLYALRAQRLERLGTAVIEKNQVIAINQRSYAQSSFALSLVAGQAPAWEHYIGLGRRLQALQMNDLHLGLMSSGYSSRSGHDLATATRLRQLLGTTRPVEACYFALGGRVSEDQVCSEGMKEDAVHIQGPAELLRQELESLLPEYMVPDQFMVLDELPLTANGKVDVQTLKATVRTARQARTLIAPRTAGEQAVAMVWCQVMQCEAVSVTDDFFEAGGNSLLAVVLINRLNRELGARLPLQAIFSHPSVEALAAEVQAVSQQTHSRLVDLNAVRTRQRPIFCWPGLGGYPMNLRGLALKSDPGRPFYGVQAVGINPGEVPHATLAEMARADIALLRERQPEGPYTLWGYSFGARVAFEAARQLEALGEQVESLVLIAPGNPRTRRPASRLAGQPRYAGPAFLCILYSVFAGVLPTAEVEGALERLRDREDFVRFIQARFDGLDQGLIERITEVVELTYEFRYSVDTLLEHRIKAPVSVLKAVGDDASFIEQALGQLPWTPVVLDSVADHYQLLKPSGLDELLALIRQAEALHRPGQQRLA